MEARLAAAAGAAGDRAGADVVEVDYKLEDTVAAGFEAGMESGRGLPFFMYSK